MPHRRTLALVVLALGAALPAAAQRAPAQRPVSLLRPHDVVRAVEADSAPSVVIAYRAPEIAEQLTLEVFDARGRALVSWGGRDGTPLPATALDSVVWNLRYPGVAGADSAEWIPGPLAPPGRYLVRLGAGPASDTASIVVRPNPRATATKMDYGEQLAFMIHVRDRLAQATAALRASRALRAEVAERRAVLPDSLRPRFDIIATVLAERLAVVETELRTAQGTGEVDQLTALLTTANATDGHPSDAQYSVFMQQQIHLDMTVERLQGTARNFIPYVNATLAMAGLAPLPPGMSLAAR